MRAPTEGSRTIGSEGKSIWAAVLIVGLGASDASLRAASVSEQEPSRASSTALTAPSTTFESMRTRLEAMPEAAIKAFYTRCSDASIGRRLDGGEAMVCSIGYEVLLAKHFGGDFERLLAWSRRSHAD